MPGRRRAEKNMDGAELIEWGDLNTSLGGWTSSNKAAVDSTLESFTFMSLN